MISVVIPTLDSERVLVRTLAALVPGSTEGLIREVLLADGGSRDETAKIADGAGCEIVSGPSDEGNRLAAAVQRARGDWLLFVDPGAVIEESWTREVAGFIAARADADRAATFRMLRDGPGTAARLGELLAAARFSLFGSVHPQQGLLIPKSFYLELGGHEAGPHPRRRLFAKIGRGRLTCLRTGILPIVDSVK